MPERLRLSRRARLPEGARSVARPHRWGNSFAVGRPYTLGDETGMVRDRSHAVELFERWLLATPAWAAAARRELAGRHLACWCPLDDQPCHAQVLLRIANPGHRQQELYPLRRPEDDGGVDNQPQPRTAR